jgi:septal ring factor EnvC (AmiA/AmiB activator)
VLLISIFFQLVSFAATQEELDVKQKQIIQALMKINKKNKKLNFELEKLTKEKDLVEISLKSNQQEIKTITAKLTETRRTLTERIKTLGKFKGENILKSMMMFPKLSQIEKNIKMMGLIAAYDMTSIQEYYNDKITLKEKIEKSKKRIATLEELSKNIEAKKKDLDKDYQVKADFLEKIKKSKMFNQVQLSRINKADSEVDDSGVLDFLTKQSLATEKGKLSAPVDGKIGEHFGYHNAEEFSSFKNTGVFVQVAENQKVSAIYQGRVVQKSQINGLGDFLILDHGDNYYSVYGNLKDIQVNVGDMIKTGQAMAKVDQKYLNNESGLYFEIRHYSNVLNPEQWIGGWDEAKTTTN